MHEIAVFITVLMLAFAIYVGVTVYLSYRNATGTTWQRLLKAAQDSATMLWAKFCLVVAGLVGQLDNVADMLGAPEAKDFINKSIGNPKLLAGVMFGIAAITIMARKRTL